MTQASRFVQSLFRFRQRHGLWPRRAGRAGRDAQGTRLRRHRLHRRAADSRDAQGVDARGLKMFSIYVDVCLTPEKGKPAYDPELGTAIRELKGRDTLILLPIWGGKPSASDLDDGAAAVVREIAGMAEKSGLRVALYPHLGMYVQRVEDAMRLVEED